jgi:hypothetical protein
MVPAWVQLWKREQQNEFDADLFARTIGRARAAPHREAAAHALYPALMVAVGPTDFDLLIKFGGGLHTRAAEDDINEREAADGQNFTPRPRAPRAPAARARSTSSAPLPTVRRSWAAARSSRATARSRRSSRPAPRSTRGTGRASRPRRCWRRSTRRPSSAAISSNARLAADRRGAGHRPVAGRGGQEVHRHGDVERRLPVEPFDLVRDVLREVCPVSDERAVFAHVKDPAPPRGT